MSLAMNEKDLRPTRYLLMLTYTIHFINEFFEQNPISQLGMIGMKDGIAVKISDMSGNPNDHINALQKIRPQEPKGNPSLENALEMSRAALFHAPSHGTREVLLVFGALHTSDPGDIHRTIESLVADKIQVKVIGLAAQVAICSEIVSKTNNGDASGYSIVLHEQHFRELMMDVTTPPISHNQTQSTSSLLMMGFPSRTVEEYPSLCACHSRPSRDGYICSRCNTKVCSLPSECPVCGLTLILSTHLARSYHHLFPLLNWTEVEWQDAWRSSTCFACGKIFPETSLRNDDQADGIKSKGKDAPRQQAQRKQDQLQTGQSMINRTGRYECPACSKHFCIDCDLFAHEVVHNCPGCQSRNISTTLMGETEIGQNGEGENNGHGENGTEVEYQ